METEARNSIVVNAPPGVVSLVDLYVGFTLFLCGYSARRERDYCLSVDCFVMCLGNHTSVYVFRALRSSNGNWNKFFLGDSYASSASATASR